MKTTQTDDVQQQSASTEHRLSKPWKNTPAGSLGLIRGLFTDNRIILQPLGGRGWRVGGWTEWCGWNIGGEIENTDETEQGIHSGSR